MKENMKASKPRNTAHAVAILTKKGGPMRSEDDQYRAAKLEFLSEEDEEELPPVCKVNLVCDSNCRKLCKKAPNES
jgi:hypothetical protein